MTEASYPGAERVSDAGGDYDAMRFVMHQVLSRTATATLVQIEKVTAAGEVAPVGFVNVKPMVAQIDGKGEPTPHGVIHNVPYFRIQGGTNAVIIDPQVGDIGIALFASHDISSVKKNKAPSNPGSRRRFDMADALYIGGVLNGTPVQYIRFSSTGVEIKAPTVTITGDVVITGDVDLSGTLQTPQDVIANGKSLKTHTHSGVTAGGANSGPPT